MLENGSPGHIEHFTVKVSLLKLMPQQEPLRTSLFNEVNATVVTISRLMIKYLYLIDVALKQTDG